MEQPCLDKTGFPAALRLPSRARASAERRGSLESVLATSLAVLLGLSEPASSDTFEHPPHRYGELANRALMRVGADFRFRLESCSGNEVVECRFSARHVTALVQGGQQPPHTAKIVIESDILQEKPGADPASMITDLVLAFGATMVVFDPQLPAERRVQLLSDLTNTALSAGRSEASGRNARYSIIFDETAGGSIKVTAVPAE